MRKESIAVVSQLLSGKAPGNPLQNLLRRTASDSFRKRILTAVEVLDFESRLQAMILLGRITKPDTTGLTDRLDQYLPKEGRKFSPEIASALGEMENGDFFERYYSLLACNGSYDSKRVLRSLVDPSTTVRYLAICLAAIIVPDAEILSALQTLGRKQRSKLLQRLSIRKRLHCIDLFLTQLKVSDRRSFLKLLSYGSTDFISSHWDDIAEELPVTVWQAIARAHPILALEKLRSLSERTFSDAPELRKVANAVLAITSELEPDVSLSVLGMLSERFSLGSFDLRNLIRYRPRALAELILRCDAASTADMSLSYHKLDREQTLTLLDKQTVRPASVPSWFRKIRPEDRASLYVKMKERLRRADGSISPDILRLLPSGVRSAEARELLNSPQLATRPVNKLLYAEFLPWEECEQEVALYLQDADAALRAQALATLVRALRYERHKANDLLELLHTKRNEQDPVRLAAATALSALPPSVWTERCLPGLDRFLSDGLAAKDLSAASVSSMQNLLIRCFPQHQQWASAWIAKIFEERGYQAHLGLEAKLTDSMVEVLAPAVLTAITRWRASEKEAFQQRLARDFGRRLRVIPQLVDMLEEQARGASEAAVAERALNTLHEHCRVRFSALVPELLANDPSWSTRNTVLQYLHARRQDLLTPYLGQQAYQGKFSSGKVRIVPSFAGCFHRWNSIQKAVYEKALAGLIDSKEIDFSDYVYGLNGLAQLPDPPVKTIAAFARRQDLKLLSTRDHAIICLSRLDGGEGIGELISCLGDERARAAAYAMRSAIKDLDRDRALSLLKESPMSGLSVAKEIVRLVGDLGSDAALAYLLELAAQQQALHLKIAIVRALWNYLDGDSAWTYFNDVARSEERQISLHLTRIPADALTESSRRRLLQLLGVLLKSNDAVVRLAVLRRLQFDPVHDRERGLTAALTKSLGSSIPDEHAAAAAAIISIYSRREPHIVGEAAMEVLPHRRQLAALIAGMLDALQQDRNRGVTATRALLSALETDKLLVTQQLQLILSALPIAEVISTVEKLLMAQQSNTNSLIAFREEVHRFVSRDDATTLWQLIDRWSVSEHEHCRSLSLVALAVLAEAKSGWDARALELLHHFRRDSSSCVAAGAQFIFPASELIPAAV